MHLNSIRIIKFADTFTPLAVITMHDRIDDCLTQRFQGAREYIRALGDPRFRREVPSGSTRP